GTARAPVPVWRRAPANARPVVRSLARRARRQNEGRFQIARQPRQPLRRRAEWAHRSPMAKRPKLRRRGDWRAAAPPARFNGGGSGALTTGGGRASEPVGSEVLFGAFGDAGTIAEPGCADPGASGTAFCSSRGLAPLASDLSSGAGTFGAGACHADGGGATASGAGRTG